MDCCGKEMERVGEIESGVFRVEALRCPDCGNLASPSVRIDGQSFWVGAMADHLFELRNKLAARLQLPSL